MLQPTSLLSGHNAAVYALTAYNAGQLLSGGGDGWIVAWQEQGSDDGVLLAQTETPVYALAYLYDRNWLVAGDMEGKVHWVDLFGVQPPKVIAMHPKGVFAIQSLDAQTLVSIGADGCLTRWAIEQRQPQETLHLTNKSLRAIALHPLLPQAAIGASDGCFYLIDIANFLVLKTIENAHLPSVFTVSYSLDGRLLWTGGRDAHICIWNTEEDYALQHRIPAHLQTVNHLLHHPSLPLVASASRDGSLKLWHAETFQLLKVWDKTKSESHLRSVNRLYWSPCGKWLFSASDDRTIRRWAVGGFTVHGARK